MSQSSGHTQIIRVGIHSVPEDQHGWRGLELPGNRKRKWYTLLENEQCLVTALLIPPGEIGVRHSHETGELNIHFSNGLPLVRWNAPGELHGGYSPQAPIDDPEQAQRLNDAEGPSARPGSPPSPTSSATSPPTWPGSRRWSRSWQGPRHP